MTTWPDGARVPQLDGLRGIAVSLVVLFHYGGPVSDIPGLGFLVRHGWAGVDLFFVMSGYLVGGIVLDKRDSPNLFAVFYARRAARIFPLYYLLLGVTAIGMAVQATSLSDVPRLPWRYIVYLQNFEPAFRGDYGPAWLKATWSLAVEEHFYLILPALAVVLKSRWLSFLLISGSMLALCLRVLAYTTLPLEHPRDFAYFFTICRLDELFLWVIIAQFSRYPKVYLILSSYRFAFQVSLIVLISVFVIISKVDVYFRGEPLLFTIGISTLGALSFILVNLAVHHNGSIVSRFTGWWVLRWLGVRTYGLYLIHIPALAVAKAAFAQSPGSAVGAPTTALVATVCLAAVSWRWFESPISAWARERFSYNRSPMPAGFRQSL